MPPGRRTNYAMREEALALRTDADREESHRHPHAWRQSRAGVAFREGGAAAAEARHRRGPGSRTDQPRRNGRALARKLGVKVIHVAERDTQVTNRPKEVNEFVNTWSVDGFVSEGCQPAELGWGTHERNFPRDAKRHDFGSGAAIYLGQPGAATRVRTWTPKAGAIHGFLITHSEAISIADYYTVREHGEVVYRPTCALRLSPQRFGRACRCTSWPAATGRCRTASGS